jgi:hypothetical protein
MENLKLSHREQEWLQDILEQFNTANMQYDVPYDWLDHRTIREYWRDSEKRWQATPFDGEKDPWQSRASKPVTRQKVTGVIAHIVDYLLDPAIIPRGKNPARKLIAQGLTDIKDWAKTKDRTFMKQMDVALDAAIFGTGYIEDNYFVKTKTKKTSNGNKNLYEDGETEWEIKKVIEYDGPKSKVISPFDVILGDIFCPILQEQPFIFKRQVIHKARAKAIYGKFQRFDLVKPGQFFAKIDGDEVIYHDSNNNGIEEDEVEVLTYMNKEENELAIILNGVPITKMGQPLPYSSGNYNLVQVLYSKFSNNIAIGKGIPDILRHEQDNLDTLYRMLIDKELLTMFPPIIQRGDDAITSDIMAPAKITAVSIDTDIQPLSVGSSATTAQTIAMIENSADASTIDRSMLGVMASGQRSATQVNQAADGVRKLLGLFSFAIATMIEDFTDIRLQIILQYWAKTKRYIDTGEAVEVIEGEFEIEGTKLRGGVSGTRIVRFEEDIPSPMEIANEERRLSLLGEKTEIMYINPNVLNDLEFYFHVQADPSERMSPSLSKALALEFFDRFKNDPYIEQKKLRADVLEKYNKNAAELLIDPAQQQQGQQQPEEGMQLMESNSPGNITSQLNAMQQPRLRDMITQEI